MRTTTLVAIVIKQIYKKMIVDCYYSRNPKQNTRKFLFYKDCDFGHNLYKANK